MGRSRQSVWLLLVAFLVAAAAPVSAASCGVAVDCVCVTVDDCCGVSAPVPCAPDHCAVCHAVDDVPTTLPVVEQVASVGTTFELMCQAPRPQRLAVGHRPPTLVRPPGGNRWRGPPA